ncbi:ATP-binding cassette domain-containing protein [Paenibacillus senegalimassiliensis]|uniref:ATP-binding cassette domain-containing protein n=1 Tax=Paenibacillus senegalimassiliensis TaxID=1737426 RepID=UPI00073EF3A0|nr:ABC transporter ATP-binding protein [Paenibacillus senegalimassiliensis]
MEQSLAVELRGVVKRRRRKKIGPIHLQIPQGYVVALVGSNGSGKSTMLKMIQRTLQPDEGDICWFGEAYAGELPLEVHQQLGYVGEVPESEESLMTAEEAARFRSRWYPAWDEERLQELLHRFEVPYHERLSRMSKGERRKFEIAATLATKPKLLLLDEPSSGLDPFAWKKLIDLLQDCLEEEDVTILLATHVIDEVKRLADYIVLVHQGQALGMIEKDQLFDSWREVWVRSAGVGMKGLPGVVVIREEGPSLSKLVVQEPHLDELEQVLENNGVQVLQTRSLELEEILELWMQGYPPAGLAGEAATYS